MALDPKLIQVTRERMERVRAGERAQPTEDRERWRAQRRAAEAAAARHERAGALEAAPPPPPSDDALERILGRNDLVGIDFFATMQRRARAVCIVELDGGGSGTGSLLSSRLLITNNHVLPDASAARDAVARFDFDRRGDAGRAFRLDPDAFFVTSPADALDYTVVALRAADEPALRDIGAVPLAPEVVRALAVGEPVNIIQHPDGGPKQFAIRENEVIAATEQVIHYQTDTNPGSSGSPVFDWRWRMVALHHSGVPRTDAAGRVLARDGRPWEPAMGEHAVDWIANEGIRVDAILVDLRARAASPDAQALLAALPPVEPAPEAHADATHPPAGAAQVLMRAPSPSPSSLAAGVGPGGAVLLTIPLHVQVSLGAPQAGGPSVAPPADVTVVTVAPSPDGLQEALRDLEGVTPRNYYDARADAARRDAYYKDVPLDADKGALFDALSAHLEDTHARTFRYEAARDRYLYPRVDLVRDGERIVLRSLYTHEVYRDPRAFIREAFEKTARFEAHVREARARESALGAEALERLVDDLEARAGFNCEHVVPQSWFRKRDPMRGDLHHLFTCDARCNSTRSNHPFFDFPDYPQHDDRPCGKQEDGRFEPRHGRGAAARAVLYFLLRYPKKIRRSHYAPDDLTMLARWHFEEPPGEWERHRNAEIHALQGNRNPFIDHPELARRVPFSAGLGG